jgi:hypothetical protein
MPILACEATVLPINLLRHHVALPSLARVQQLLPSETVRFAPAANPEGLSCSGLRHVTTHVWGAIFPSFTNCLGSGRLTIGVSS